MSMMKMHLAEACPTIFKRQLSGMIQVFYIQEEFLLLAVPESAHWFIYYIKIWAHIPPPQVFIYGIYR